MKNMLLALLVGLLALTACTTPAAIPTVTLPPPTAMATATPIPPTATATATPIPPTATATPIPPTATATPIPPTATATAAPATSTPTLAPAPAGGGDTAKTHPGGVVLSNGWVQYTSEQYGGTTIAVPPDWWCIDYDTADQDKTIDAIAAAANDQFGMIKMLLNMRPPDHLFFCLSDLDKFIAQEESGVKVFLSLQAGFTRAIDMLQDIDRAKWTVSELSISGYDAASYEGFQAKTKRYERNTILLLTPPRTFDVQSYSQTQARIDEVKAIEQTLVIKLK